MSNPYLNFFDKCPLEVSFRDTAQILHSSKSFLKLPYEMFLIGEGRLNIKVYNKFTLTYINEVPQNIIMYILK